MFLTVEKFLAHFPNIKISRKEFAKKLIITYRTPITLEEGLFTEEKVVNRSQIKIDRETGSVVNRGGKSEQIKIKSKIIKATDPRREREAVIDFFYQMVVTHRHYYLRKFYEAYFAQKNPFGKNFKWDSKVDIELDESDDVDQKGYSGNLSLQKNDASRRVIRNLFYLELLHLTKVTNTVKSQVSFWGALDNLYNKLLLEDRLFAPSSIGLFLREKKTKKVDLDIPKPPRGFKGFNPKLNYHNLFYLIQGYQPKASIINPYFIHWCLENLFDDLGTEGSDGKGKGRILTPVLSWGSYLMGFFHSKGWHEYVGIDVMPSVCDKVGFLGDYYLDLLEDEKRGISKKIRDELSDKTVDLWCQPSEVLGKDKKFMGKYKGHFDLVLICPPYFNMEVYHEGQQSTDLYPDYQEWIKGYWEPTVKMSWACCRKGGKFAMIVNNYCSLDGTFYPLVDDLRKVTEKVGFKFEEYYFLFNRTSPLRVNKKDRTERLVIFKK